MGLMGLLTRHGGGELQDARLVVLVEDGVVLSERILLDANLVAVNAAEGEELAVGAAGERVVGAAVDVGDVVVLEAADDARDGDDGIGLAGQVGVARLGVVVQAPGPELAAVVDVEARVRAGGNLDGMSRLGEASAHRRVQARLRAAPSRHALARELRLSTAAPGEHLAVPVQRQHVVRPGSKTNNLVEAGNLHRSVLHLDLWGEAKNAIVALLSRTC